MALNPSPRKHVVPLASGDEPRARTSTSAPTITKRVFYCGVVVEGSENGRRLPDGAFYRSVLERALIETSLQKYRTLFFHLAIRYPQNHQKMRPTQAHPSTILWVCVLKITIVLLSNANNRTEQRNGRELSWIQLLWLQSLTNSSPVNDLT